MSKEEAKRFLDWLNAHDKERRRIQEMNDNDVVQAARDLGFSFKTEELHQELQETRQTEWTFFR
ncbi:MAG TPA: Nif11-like leader peptide family natural product precursor [Desulfomicrobiaceae bacterium]|nr:Nif11-like leader peptide family natural product precursor [Desulfomicrobiaceae bacterium]